jgi:nucleotide-binding universal stress UspA family protein
MRSILVPTEHDEVMDAALETALLLGRRCDSYIEGFALRWGTREFAGADIMGGVMPPDDEEVTRRQSRARKIFESFMQKHDVPRSTTTADSLSYGWLNNAPEGDGFVGSYGRVFDVIVINRPDRNKTILHERAIYSGLFESGRPILMAPPSPPHRVATNVLIAWNRSAEQTRAIAFATPILQKADRVTVLTVIGGTEVSEPSAEQLIRYLQRNRIVAELKRVDLESRNTGQTILATAQSLGCDLLIKGAYTQSRLKQIIFGGATQHILENAKIPVLLAH